VDEKSKELEMQTYCCGECGRQFEYRELRCYSRFCPNCCNFMVHIDDTEQVQNHTEIVIGGYF
jgi:hypothetical protein